MSGSGSQRQSTGVPGLDELLGGGLIPGTLTVIVGATGIGKTQLGLQFEARGEGRVYKQSPTAGSEVNTGQTIYVDFGRVQ